MFHQENAVSKVERAIASSKLPTITLDDLHELTGLSSNELVFACLALDTSGKASYDINSWPATITRLAGNQYD